MALKAVNTFPDSSSAPMSPNDPVLVGLRSTTATVDPGTVNVMMGFSGVDHGSSLPEDDSTLVDKVQAIDLETVERRSPASAEVGRAIVAGKLELTKPSNSPNDKCIYSIKTEIGYDASVLAHVALRTDALWATQSPDWLNLSDVVCPYVALEHGQHNTACYVFFRKTGVSSGELIVGGPLPGLTAARPGQVALPVDWAALPTGSLVELWIHFRNEGYSAPTTTLPPPSSAIVANVPVVEVWTKLPADAAPVVQFRNIVSALGSFPPATGSFSNSRYGPEDSATLFLGNAGLTSDVLTVDDWTLYPDFRIAIEDGTQSPSHEVTRICDLLSVYSAKDGKVPSKADLIRWAPVSGWDPVTETMAYPGWSSLPSHVVLSKDGDVASALSRDEPRIGTVTDGCMFEAFMAARESRTPTDQVFGAGIGVDDGTSRFQVVTSFYPSPTLGLSKSVAVPGDASLLYLSSTPIDWHSRKLVRLTVDRHRSKVYVEVDDQKVIEKLTSDAFPASIGGTGKLLMGHLLDTLERGSMDISYARYIQRYKAWEAVDGNLPTAAPVAFALDASGTGSTDALSPGDTKMVIRKDDFSTAGSKRAYTRSDDFSGHDGVYLDFTARVAYFNGPDGSLMSPGNWSGVGVKIGFGGHSLTLGFFDCGIYGKKVGVIPGSGSISDILTQSALGKAFSTSVDWLQTNRYRLFYNPGRSIDLYLGSTVLPPTLSIPWSNETAGFDLPSEVIPQSISFGHLFEDTASVSEWGYVRFGQGNGENLSIKQNFPYGLKNSHFGGRVFYLVGCDE